MKASIVKHMIWGLLDTLNRGVAISLYRGTQGVQYNVTIQRLRIYSLTPSLNLNYVLKYKAS